MIVRNQVWGLPVAIEMTLLAVASFAVVWAYIYWRRGDVKAAAVGGALGVVLPAAALGILASELLKPPTAGILVLPLLNPHANLSSWMVWGATGISLLILWSLLFTLPLIKPLDRIAVWGRSKLAMNLLGLLTAAFGVYVALYTGLVLAYERGIPFWHSAAVPLLALFMGVAAGSGLYGILGKTETGRWIAAGSGLTALTYLIHLHLSSLGPAAAAFSAQGAASDPAALGGVALAALATVAAVFSRRPAVMAAGILAIAAVFLIRASLLLWGAWDFP
ncbi:MAG: NrfD/PsrC family molybdoenzyme membrane anchor subunit [Pyrobaculum sp.]